MPDLTNFVSFMKRLLFGILSSFLFFICGCEKNEQFVFEVEPVQIYQSAVEKKTLKPDIAFISIAFADIFQKPINANDLSKLQLPVIAFGDKKLMIDVVIKNFLNSSDAVVPSNSIMRNDLALFINNTYLRIYNRYPTTFELWKLTQLIEQDANLTPTIIYYAMMTSEEYRFF